MTTTKQGGPTGPFAIKVSATKFPDIDNQYVGALKNLQPAIDWSNSVTADMGTAATFAIDSNGHMIESSGQDAGYIAALRPTADNFPFVTWISPNYPSATAPSTYITCSISPIDYLITCTTADGKGLLPVVDKQIHFLNFILTTDTQSTLTAAVSIYAATVSNVTSTTITTSTTARISTTSATTTTAAPTLGPFFLKVSSATAELNGRYIGSLSSYADDSGLQGDSVSSLSLGSIGAPTFTLNEQSGALLDNLGNGDRRMSQAKEDLGSGVWANPTSPGRSYVPLFCSVDAGSGVVACSTGSDATAQSLVAVMNPNSYNLAWVASGAAHPSYYAVDLLAVAN